MSVWLLWPNLFTFHSIECTLLFIRSYYIYINTHAYTDIIYMVIVHCANNKLLSPLNRFFFSLFSFFVYHSWFPSRFFIDSGTLWSCLLMILLLLWLLEFSVDFRCFFISLFFFALLTSASLSSFSSSFRCSQLFFVILSFYSIIHFVYWFVKYHKTFLTSYDLA